MDVVLHAFRAGLALWIAVSALAARAEELGPPTRHALWQVEDARQPLYLLGSIHVLRRQHYPLERPIEFAFDGSKVAVFETDVGTIAESPDRPSPRKVAARRARPLMLRQQVSPETYARVTRYLDEVGAFPRRPSSGCRPVSRR